MAEPPQNARVPAPVLAEAMDRARAYEQQRATVMGKGLETLTAPLAAMIRRALPAELAKTALDVADRAAGMTLPAELHAHDTADLAACEAAALRVQAWSAGTNAATGGVAGWFGFAGLAADIPTTLTLAARNVRATAAAYGFDASDERETAFRLMVLDLATAQADAGRADRIDRINQLARLLSRPDVRYAAEQAGGWVTEKVIERIARQMGVSLAGRKTVQIVPIVGGVVAAAVNASFQTDVSRAARYAYRQRWLMQQKLLPPPTTDGIS